jgi:flavin-dependent thymidylate synthase
MITVIKPHFYWPETTKAMFPLVMEHIERCGRVCYKSEDRITNGSADRFVRKICRNRHVSVLEHFSLTAIVVCSRACSHQLVRHRIAAYSQESQRYCNYGKKSSLQVICPKSIGVAPGDYTTEQVEPEFTSSEWMVWRNDENFAGSLRQFRWVVQVDSAYSEYYPMVYHQKMLVMFFQTQLKLS